MGVPVNVKQVFKSQMESYDLTDVIKSADQELQSQAGDYLKKLSSMMSGAGDMQQQAPQQNPPLEQAVPTA
jgi:hypothetical protein